MTDRERVEDEPLIVSNTDENSAEETIDSASNAAATITGSSNAVPVAPETVQEMFPEPVRKEDTQTDIAQKETVAAETSSEPDNSDKDNGVTGEDVTADSSQAQAIAAETEKASDKADDSNKRGIEAVREAVGQAQAITAGTGLGTGEKDDQAIEDAAADVPYTADLPYTQAITPETQAAPDEDSSEVVEEPRAETRQTPEVTDETALVSDEKNEPPMDNDQVGLPQKHASLGDSASISDQNVAPPAIENEDQSSPEDENRVIYEPAYPSQSVLIYRETNGTKITRDPVSDVLRDRALQIARTNSAAQATASVDGFSSVDELDEREEIWDLYTHSLPDEDAKDDRPWPEILDKTKPKTILAPPPLPTNYSRQTDRAAQQPARAVRRQAPRDTEPKSEIRSNAISDILAGGL